MLSRKSKPFANESLRSPHVALSSPGPAAAAIGLEHIFGGSGRTRVVSPRFVARVPLAPTDGADADETQRKALGNPRRSDLTRGTDDPSVNRPQAAAAAAALRLSSTPCNASATGASTGWLAGMPGGVRSSRAAPSKCLSKPRGPS